jgi:hypothetical protein
MTTERLGLSPARTQATPSRRSASTKASTTRPTSRGCEPACSHSPRTTAGDELEAGGRSVRVVSQCPNRPSPDIAPHAPAGNTPVFPIDSSPHCCAAAVSLCTCCSVPATPPLDHPVVAAHVPVGHSLAIQTMATTHVGRVGCTPWPPAIAKRHQSGGPFEGHQRAATARTSAGQRRPGRGTFVQSAFTGQCVRSAPNTASRTTLRAWHGAGRRPDPITPTLRNERLTVRDEIDHQGAPDDAARDTQQRASELLERLVTDQERTAELVEGLSRDENPQPAGQSDADAGADTSARQLSAMTAPPYDSSEIEAMRTQSNAGTRQHRP